MVFRLTPVNTQFNLSSLRVNMLSKDSFLLLSFQCVQTTLQRGYERADTRSFFYGYFSLVFRLAYSSVFLAYGNYV